MAQVIIILWWSYLWKFCINQNIFRNTNWLIVKMKQFKSCVLLIEVQNIINVVYILISALNSSHNLAISHIIQFKMGNWFSQIYSYYFTKLIKLDVCFHVQFLNSENVALQILYVSVCFRAWNFPVTIILHIVTKIDTRRFSWWRMNLILEVTGRYSLHQTWFINLYVNLELVSWHL